MFKEKSKPTEPATTPGAVFQPEYSVVEPEPVVLEAYVVNDDGKVDEVELESTNKPNDGHSITDEESGSESGDKTQVAMEGAAGAGGGDKKYCGGRLTRTTLILCIAGALLAVIVIPIALVKKNDVFTRSNGDTVSGTCRAPRCFTDNDCSFFGPSMDEDNGNGTNAPTSPWQCNHAVLRCANERNLMADFCPCFRDSDCISGRWYVRRSF